MYEGIHDSRSVKLKANKSIRITNVNLGTAVKCERIRRCNNFIAFGVEVCTTTFGDGERTLQLNSSAPLKFPLASAAVGDTDSKGGLGSESD